MKPQACGFWGISHWILDAVGRGTLWCLPERMHPKGDGAYSLIGGALLGALFGAAFGFFLFDQPSGLDPVTGAMIGALLGLCMGICCGATIQSTDNLIRGMLRSLGPK